FDTSDSFCAASLLYFVRSSLAMSLSIGTFLYSLSGPTGFASTFGARMPFALRPALYSAIRLLGESPWKQEYSSQTPQEEQNIVLTKMFGSCISLHVAASINLFGSIGCPSRCLGHKSVHIVH